MNENIIRETLQKGERVTLECKKAQSSVPNSVWETYSAFANTNGGLILSAWNEKHWLKPELIEQPELFQVKLILSIETKKSEAVMQNSGIVNDTDTNNKNLMQLTERQINIIKFLLSNNKPDGINGTVRINDIAAHIEVSRRTIIRELELLAKAGIVVHKGSDKKGYWQIDTTKIDAFLK